MTAKTELAVRAALKTLPPSQRDAIGTVLEDLTDQLKPYVGDETIGGDTKLQFTGKLAGVWLVQERVNQLIEPNPAREQEFLAALQRGEP